MDQDCDGEPDGTCAPLAAPLGCAGAFDATADTVYRATLDATSPSGSASACGGNGPEAYFTFALATQQIVYLSTYGSSMDTVLSLLDGCGGTEITCADDDCTTDDAHLLELLDPGTYVVSVRAKAAGVSGVAQLKVQRSTCTNAQFVTGEQTVDFNLAAQTNDALPTCSVAGNPLSGTGPDMLLFTQTCPGNNEVTFDSCRSTVDTILEVRSGSCDGEAVTCNDDHVGRCAEAPVDAGSPRASFLHAELAGTGAGDGMWFLSADSWSTASGTAVLHVKVGD